MPRLARFWDSLENDNLFDIVPQPAKPTVSRFHQQWLSNLAHARDDELQTILYAKPVLPNSESIGNFHEDEFYGAKKISVGYSKSMLSTSLGNLSAPPKPQRRIARLRSTTNDCAASLPQLLEKSSLCSPETTNNNHIATDGSSTTLCSSVHADSCPTDTDEAIVRKIKLPGFRGDIQRVLSHKSPSPSAFRTPTPRGAPPTYEQFQVIRRNSMKSSTSSARNGILSPLPPTPSGSRSNTVTVNGAHVQQAMNKIDTSTDSANTILRSPYSTRSDSITSVDSGQCSGEQIERRSLCSVRQESKEEDDSGLPSYARMASTMDHVLRTSSALYNLLSSPLDAGLCRDLLAKSSVFLQLLESSPCANYLPKNEVGQLKMNVQELMKNREKGTMDMNNMTNFFAILLRKTIESVLLVFVRLQIICKYLSESNGKDRLIPISLEHLIHICLFGDELCIEAIQKNCISSVVRMMKTEHPQESTLRFLLRTLAVLCGVSKGALALLTQGGLELVVDRLLSVSSSVCSVEAAGILTQLTNPQSAFIRLTHVQPIISRLLDLVDQCKSGDSLLLATAALNNVTLQHPNGLEIMYKSHAIRRLICAYNRENCATIFVQEQIVTAFSRLAARHLEQQMVEQNAIPVLLEFLSLTHPVHADYCRRIRYKAAVCIGTLANSEVGLKALYDNKAYAILSNVLYDDNNAANPFNMICNNIRTKLESKYQSESAV